MNFRPASSRRNSFGLIFGLCALLGIIDEPRASAVGQRARIEPLRLVTPGEEPPYRAAVLLDSETGALLYEHQANEPTFPGGLTKLMVVLLAAEQVEQGKIAWTDPVPTSKWAASMGGSQVFLAEGEIFPLNEIISAILVHSANDAAVAVAEHLFGSTQRCIEAMNQRASEIGMRNTRFFSVHGLPPDDGQHADSTTALDVAVLSRALVRHVDILRWASIKQMGFRHDTMTLRNPNTLLSDTDFVDGLASVSLKEAGTNVALTGYKNSLRLVAVVLGARTSPTALTEGSRILNQGFSGYQKVVAVKKGAIVAVDVRIKGGKPGFVRVIAGESLSILARRGDKRSYRLQLALDGELTPPLLNTDAIGEVLIFDGAAEIGRVKAFLSEPVAKSSVLDRFRP